MGTLFDEIKSIFPQPRGANRGIGIIKGIHRASNLYMSATPKAHRQREDAVLSLEAMVHKLRAHCTVEQSGNECFFAERGYMTVQDSSDGTVIQFFDTVEEAQSYKFAEGLKHVREIANHDGVKLEDLIVAEIEAKVSAFWDGQYGYFMSIEEAACSVENANIDAAKGLLPFVKTEAEMSEWAETFLRGSQVGYDPEGRNPLEDLQKLRCPEAYDGLRREAFSALYMIRAEDPKHLPTNTEQGIG